MRITFKNFTKTVHPLPKDKLSEADIKIAQEINTLTNDIDKILEFEHIKSKQKPFVIIDKSKSQANIYQDKELIDKFEVGVGEEFGDDLNSSTYKNGQFSTEGRTTPSGQFYTSYGLDFKNKTGYEKEECINYLLLNGIQHPADFKDRTKLALHQVAKNKPERVEMFKTQGIRRSMSTGCINFLPEDFYRLTKDIPAQKTDIFILPEEKGNKLELVALPNGLWFKTKYANREKENIFLDAMSKFFKL